MTRKPQPGKPASKADGPNVDQEGDEIIALVEVVELGLRDGPADSAERDKLREIARAKPGVIRISAYAMRRFRENLTFFEEDYLKKIADHVKNEDREDMVLGLIASTRSGVVFCGPLLRVWETIQNWLISFDIEEAGERAWDILAQRYVNQQKGDLVSFALSQAEKRLVKPTIENNTGVADKENRPYTTDGLSRTEADFSGTTELPAPSAEKDFPMLPEGFEQAQGETTAPAVARQHDGASTPRTDPAAFRSEAEALQRPHSVEERMLLGELPASLRGRGYSKRNIPPDPESVKSAFRVLSNYTSRKAERYEFSDEEMAVVRAAGRVKYAHIKFLKLKGDPTNS